MNLRDEIEKIFRDAVSESSLKCSAGGRTINCDANELRDAIFALPAFAPQVERDWPDAEGWWIRRGVMHQVVVVEYTTHGDVIKVLLPGQSDGIHVTGKQMHGHWLPAHLVIPPVAEPMEDNSKIGPAELFSLFGETMPIKAAQILCDDALEPFQVRRQLRMYADQRKDQP